jgi:predicted ester cyclase
MSALDVIKAGLAATAKGDWAQADTLLADDLVFAGPVPEPVGKREFIGIQGALSAAFPDWNFNVMDLKEDGDKVTGVVQITGTHTMPLSLPLPGVPTIPPTGKQIRLPREPISFTVKNGKITRIDATVVPGGGVMGVLAQLGVQIPQSH